MASRQGASGSASGGQLEEKLDLTLETDACLAATEPLLATHNNLAEALTLLGGMEKKCRTGNDTVNLARVCTAAVQACHAVNDNDALVATLIAWATKRSQKSSAIQALVAAALPYCVVPDTYLPLPLLVAGESSANNNNNAVEKQIRETLVVTLRDLTDGKLFLERERAQLTRVYATLKEQDGDIAKAADILQEVHVETYGSLSKKEKVEYILEQLRLTVDKRDFIRASIVAGKINRKHLVEMPDYKVRFYTLLATVHRHDTNALELVKDYHAIYSTLVQQEQQQQEKKKKKTSDDAMHDDDNTPDGATDNETAWMEALQAVVVFLALTPLDNERQDILLRLSIDERLEKLPACQLTVETLLKKEIIHYPLPHQEELEGLAVVQEGGLGPHWHDIFFRRIIQHNIRVAALYYTRIHGARLAQLLQLSPDVLEQEIASMVSDGTVFAKIDRPADIVRFEAKKSPESVLTNWVTDIDQLLQLVETTTHLIHKEKMTAH